jgi:hypothetical protein
VTPLRTWSLEGLPNPFLSSKVRNLEAQPPSTTVRYKLPLLSGGDMGAHRLGARSRDMQMSD